MAKTPLKIVFMGTAELACASLEKLAHAPGILLLSVVTQPDRPRGRSLKLLPSPVKALAQKLHLPVDQPEKARNPQFIQRLQSLAPDLIVVAAYGQILPPAILSIPRLGCFNVHTSLLPQYRGAAPIQWAILNGDQETGVTIMLMDQGLDTGDMLAQTKTPIQDEDNAATLHDRLAHLGADLLLQTIQNAIHCNLHPQPQPATASSYARKIVKSDGLLDWSQPARTLWNRVRAFTPWPGAFTYLEGDSPAPPRLLKIWNAHPVASPSGTARPGQVLQADKTGIVVACAPSEALCLTEVQLEGGKRLPAEPFLAGHPLRAGSMLGNPPAPLA